MQATPLHMVLGPEIGRVVRDIHQAAGVSFRTGERVRQVKQCPGGLVVHTDHAELHCRLLLVATGTTPNIELLAGSGLDLTNGVPVDEYCRTGIERIFAAGDAVAHFHPLFGRTIRVEHYDNAIKQGAAAAASMLGPGKPFRDPHWFWSDQYQHNLQSVGIPDGCDQVILRGSVDEAAFSAFYLASGVVRAVAISEKTITRQGYGRFLCRSTSQVQKLSVGRGDPRRGHLLRQWLRLSTFRRQGRSTDR